MVLFEGRALYADREQDDLCALADVEGGGGCVAGEVVSVVTEAGDGDYVSGGLGGCLESVVAGGVAEGEVDVAVAFDGVPDTVFRAGGAWVEGDSGGGGDLVGGEVGAGVWCLRAQGRGGEEECG